MTRLCCCRRHGSLVEHLLWIVCSMLIVQSRLLADVDSTGSFTTELRIKVPPFHGLEPAVSLRYRTGGGNSLAGSGWRLDAGAQIDRVSAYRGVPRFDETDRFLMDGQELVPCPPGSDPTSSPSCTSSRDAFGSSAGFFSTRWESFVRIQKDSPSPDQWTVWRKDGSRMVFAPLQTVDGKTARWAVSYVTDTHSNLLTAGTTSPTYAPESSRSGARQ